MESVSAHAYVVSELFAHISKSADVDVAETRKEEGVAGRPNLQNEDVGYWVKDFIGRSSDVGNNDVESDGDCSFPGGSTGMGVRDIRSSLGSRNLASNRTRARVDESHYASQWPRRDGVYLSCVFR